MIYASSSLALAALEFFVHLEPNFAPDDLQAFAGELPEAAIERLAPGRWPRGWDGFQSEAARRVGDGWVRAGRSAALQVPSTAVPGEWNVLLNPSHNDFGRFRPLRPTPFRFDARMFKR